MRRRRGDDVRAWANAPCPPACTCEAIRYLNRIGTSVKESTRLAASEMITESDNGENRYLAVPLNENTGTKTTLIDKVARNVGVATSLVPLRIASMIPSPSPTWRSM